MSVKDHAPAEGIPMRGAVEGTLLAAGLILMVNSPHMEWAGLPVAAWVLFAAAAYEMEHIRRLLMRIDRKLSRRFD